MQEQKVETSSLSRRIDRHVGAKIRERRTMLGFTQQAMAELIGVSYQQAFKYEHGMNRVSAGRLYEIAQVLGVPVTFFYEGWEDASEQVPVPKRQCLDLSRNFARIENTTHQTALAQLCRALAEHSAKSSPDGLEDAEILSEAVAGVAIRA